MKKYSMGNLSTSMANPGSILKAALELVASKYDDITIRYYQVADKVAASIMPYGRHGFGQRNFIPTVHVVVAGDTTNVTWSDVGDEDLGQIAACHTDKAQIANLVLNAINQVSVPEEEYAYELEGDPSDAELDEIELSKIDESYLTPFKAI